MSAVTIDSHSEKIINNFSTWVVSFNFVQFLHNFAKFALFASIFEIFTPILQNFKNSASISLDLEKIFHHFQCKKNLIY